MLEMLRQMGVYPYEYVDSFERFAEMQLPPKEAFYSQLSKEHVSGKDYTHAKRVWKEFSCKTFGDYHDLYLCTDVHLLADVFETFRDTSMEYYGLDPARQYETEQLETIYGRQQFVWGCYDAASTCRGLYDEDLLRGDA